MNKRIRFFLDHWKLGYHLTFRTKRFGVNNKRWCGYDSIFGWPIWKQIYSVIIIRPMLRNIKSMKMRAGSMAHFMTDEEYRLVYNEEK